MILAHKILLQPTKNQSLEMEKLAEVCRIAWNWGLRRWQELYQLNKSKPDTWEKPSQFAIDRLWTKAKKSWSQAGEVDSQAPKRAFANLARAYKNFWAKRADYPTLKKRSSAASFYVPNTVLKPEGRHIHVGKIGAIRMRHPLRLEGKIQGATVTKHLGKWYVSIQVDVGDIKLPRSGNREIGIDLGIGQGNAIVASDGEILTSPRSLATGSKLLRRKKRLQRRVSRRKKGSSNQKKAKAAVAKLEGRIANLRNNFQHQSTSHLCKTSAGIGIEDLRVSGMVQNHKLARSVSDAGMGEIRRQIEYKSVRYGIQVEVADQFYPSTQTCSCCGVRKTGEDKLSLADRKFRCDACGFVENRDLNAAKNLERLLRERLHLIRMGRPLTPSRISAIVSQ